MGTKWNGLARNKPPQKIRSKTLKRNKDWKQICLDRAKYLMDKYGQIVCEYSGETITTLSTVPNSPDEAWGHHIDSQRSNCCFDNCYIVKYKYHRFIEDNNIKVSQEDFQGKRK